MTDFDPHRLRLRAWSCTAADIAGVLVLADHRISALLLVVGVRRGAQDFARADDELVDEVLYPFRLIGRISKPLIEF
jgi:hypothetical protein